MGAAQSSLNEEEAELQKVMTALRNKLEAIELGLTQARGDNSVTRQTEVSGGRTVMRTSEIRAATNTGVDKQILAGIHDFFTAAHGGIDGDNQGAKHAAVAGAEKVLGAGINALLGVKSGQSQEKRDFIILFLNNAFVRVDYFLYSYSVSAKKWGEEANRAGICYMADLAVLDLADLKPSEVDYLVSQALSVGAADFEAVAQIKLELVQMSVLSRMLSSKTTTFKDIADAATSLAKSQKTISESFASLKPHRLSVEAAAAKKAGDGDKAETEASTSTGISPPVS